MSAALLVSWTAAAAQTPSPEGQRGATLDASGFRYQRALPEGPAGLTVLPLDAGALAHSQGPLRTFADVRIVDRENAQIPYLLERRDERLSLDLELRSVAPQSRELREQPVPGRSFYGIALPYEGLPGPVIAIATTATVFRRPVVIGVERPPDRRRRDVWFEELTRAVWEHADASIPAPPLELALPFERSRELLLIVDEGDNRPLPLTSVKLLLPGWQLRFHRPSGPLRLLYGKDDITEPRYDVSRLAPDTLSGTATTIAAEPEQQPAPPARVVSTGAFWAGLAVAVVLLLGVLVRLISSGTARPPSRPRP